VGLKIDFNPAQLEANIRQIGERAVKGMTVVMKRRIILIRDLARSYAPRDTGLLESNIEWATHKGGDRRNIYSVYIDLDAIRRRGNGELGDYAWLMEENLKPYGSGKYNLGKGSLAKKIATGKKVGGRFLRRAVQEGSQKFMDDMVIAVRRVTGDNRVVSVNYQRDNDNGDDE
jgi:hypothetical protein